MTNSTPLQPESEKDPCAYEGCFNPRDDYDDYSLVQSWFCGFHRYNDVLTIESVTYDHKHNSRNNLHKNIEAYIQANYISKDRVREAIESFYTSSQEFRNTNMTLNRLKKKLDFSVKVEVRDILKTSSEIE